MKVNNHSKMHRLVQLSIDGWLTPSQKQALDAHLAVCAECRDYAAELKALETQLASVSVTRLIPQKPRATAQQAAAIQASYRRHTMKKQILSAAGALVAITAVAVLILLFGHIVPRQSSPAVAPTGTVVVTAVHEFGPIEPTWLPEGYSYFNSKSLNDGQTICLYYHGPGDDPQYPSLVIAQSRTDLPTMEKLRDPMYAETNTAPENIPFSRETVQVGGASGEATLLETGIDVSQLCGGTRLPLDRVLMWQAGDLNFALFAQSDSWMGLAFLSKLEMRRVAESMTGVSTIVAGTLDPERLPSAESVATLSGFTVTEPATIPNGYQFDHAAYWQAGESRNMLLVYRSQDISSPGFYVRQTSGTTETLETRFTANPEIYEKVGVESQPALFSIGYCWDENNKPFNANCGAPQSLIWFENGVEYNIVGFFPKESIIIIAESLR